jgi:hypothetical protein
MVTNSRRTQAILAGTAIAVGLALTGGCAGRAPATTSVPPQAPPLPVKRALEPLVARFEPMMRTFVPLAGDVLLEVEPIDNGFGKDLPEDLTPFVRNAVDAIGSPFRSIRAFLGRRSIAPPIYARDRPVGPPAAYRVTGSVVKYHDERMTDVSPSKDIIVPPLRFDVSWGKGERESTTSIMVALTLEKADGISIPGAVATYVYQVRRFERQKSVALYAFGTGGTWGASWSFAEDPADGMQAALTASLMQILSNAYLLPVWRLQPGAPIDARLVERYRRALGAITAEQLQILVKRLLFLHGAAVDRSRITFAPADLPIVVAEMRSRGIDQAASAALIDLAVQLWSGDLDFVQGASRVGEYNQIFLTLPPPPVVKPFGPADFDWPAGTKIMLLDLTRVADAALRAKIVSVVSRWAGAARVRRYAEQRTVVAVRPLGEASAILPVLRAEGWPLQFVWTTDQLQQSHLVIADAAPAKTTAAASELGK